MKLLLIGGTGFFGKSILDSFNRDLLKRFKIEEIIVVSRNSKNFISKHPELLNDNISFFDADISICNNLPEFDYVIHAATSSNKLDYVNDEKSQLTNIELGASNFISLIKKINKNIKILYCSSGAVYGQQPQSLEKISENHPFMPLDSLEKEKRIYALGKRTAEKKIFELSSYGYSCVIARCFSFYGKYLPKDQHFADGIFTRMAENNQDIVVKAKNRVYRSYMSSDKLVDNLFHLLISANSNCEVFNVGSSDAILIHDLAKKISKKYKVNIQKYEIDEKLPHDRYVPDTTKLNKLINSFKL